MTSIKRSEIVAKLNPTCRQALDAAIKSAKIRGNPYVELVHFVEQLALIDRSDFSNIAEHFSVNFSELTSDLTREIDDLPRGSTSISDLSEHIFDSIERAWVHGTLHFADTSVRSGYIILGILRTQRLSRMLDQMSSTFGRISADDLEAGFPGIVANSMETPDSSSGNEPGTEQFGGTLQGSALGKFATDLTEKAKNGEMDPIVGRDDEIRQIVSILLRRRQNNPILTGEAGVGKTAVVEGFAQRIARGDVPPQLQNVTLQMLDIGLLQAGASVKGEFENRLRSVIEEVQSSEKPIILFIDEAHTLIGAGGAAGTGDAANLLKPALARGTLRTIAATTWAEYKMHIEKDPALTRRFEVVKVEEPSEEKAIFMMRNIAPVLEKHHGIEVLDEAVEAAVRLSSRYVPARQLPDKALSLLDTACARVAVSQHGTPAEVEAVHREIDALKLEQQILKRQAKIGIEDNQRENEIKSALESSEATSISMDEKWQKEKNLVSNILDMRTQLTGENEISEPSDGASPEDSDAHEDLRTELRDKLSMLSNLQGEEPLVLATVDAQAVAGVVQNWTGIPVGRMVKNEIDAVLNLAARLSERVVGQDHAMELISQRIQSSRAGLVSPTKPIGVFMLCGPSGVGKTETALALAESLYGGEQNLITINMSEFQEAHTVSTLKGAPPGYVGYGEGGVLTEAVRRRPYSVVLLDEVEKAHPDVHEIFFQVFDKGNMEDGEGRSIDFKNTLILLTSNVGSDLIMDMCEDPDLAPEPEGIAKALRTPLLKIFPAALLGRLNVIPYYPLSDDMINTIARLQLKKIQQRMLEAHGATLEYTDDVLALIRNRCTELESGGRMIDAILTNSLLPTISREVLKRITDGEDISTVKVSVVDSEFSYQF